MQEEWRPVVGYEGLYEISNLGRVKSVERTMTSMRKDKDGVTKPYTYHVKEKVLKQGRRIDGYSDVSLSKNGKTVLYCIHRLLAESWIPNPYNYRFVNHIDLDKTNNSLNNLEWISQQGNVIHAVERYSNPQSIAIYCKETNQVYASMGQCDRALGLHQGDTWKTINEGRQYGYTLSIATENQIAEAKMSIDAQCSWTFHKAKKGRLYPIRKIKCIDTQQVFDTLKQAAEACNGCEDSIRHSIRSRTTYKGLTFYYLDDAPEDEQSYMIEAQNKFYYNTHFKHNWKG